MIQGGIMTRSFKALSRRSAAGQIFLGGKQRSEVERRVSLGQRLVNNSEITARKYNNTTTAPNVGGGSRCG